MSDSDAFVLDNAMTSGEEKLSRFYGTRNMAIPDINNGSYSSGEVQFSMPSLSTQDAHVNLAESYVQIPYKISIAASNPFTLAENAACLKGSFLSLVSSLSLRIDNQQVLTRTDFSSIPMHFQILNQSTQNDVANGFDELCMAVDDEQTLDYISLVGEHAPGNSGLTTRNAKLGYNPANARRAKFTSLAKTTSQHKTNVVVTDQLVEYHILAILPLKHLSPIFSRAQLLKGAFLEFFLSVHSGSAQYSVTMPAGADGQAAITMPMVNTVTTTPKFEIFPVMIDPARMTALRAVGGNTDTVFTITAGIDTTTNLGLRTCQFHAKLYQLRPEAEAEYASAISSKRIDYPSYHLHTSKAIAPNARTRIQVINSAQKMRTLLIHTAIGQATNGGVGATPAASNGVGAFSPIASPFSPSPLTCAPECGFHMLQVYIGGKPRYETAIEYGYEMYKEQFQANQLMLDGDRSGLLSEKSWSEGYGYILVDLQRLKNDSEDLMNKSLEIEFYNNSLYPIDIRCFLAMEQTVEISTQTGKVIRA